MRVCGVYAYIYVYVLCIVYIWCVCVCVCVCMCVSQSLARLFLESLPRSTSPDTITRTCTSSHCNHHSHKSTRLSSLSCPILWKLQGPLRYYHLPEYTYLNTLPAITYLLFCLSLPDTRKAVDTRDLRALRDLCLQRTCQRHRSSVRIPAHSPLYVQERPLTALEEVHHCCY